MAAGENRTAERIRADRIASKAKDGQLIHVGSYSLQYSKRYRIGVDPNAVRNLPVEPSDDVDCWIDYERGLAVYDFGGSLTPPNER